MRKFACVAMLLLLGGLPASAEEPTFIGDNHSWNVTCGEFGYQLKSKYPVSRFIEQGADSFSTEEVETIRMSRTCEALHSQFGKGKWCQANGGFAIELDNQSIGFARQELSCPDGTRLEAGCAC